MKKLLTTFALSQLALSPIIADTVITKNGSSINGTIVELDGGALTIDTPFGGKITIDQKNIERLETDNPIFVSTKDGSTFQGTVSSENDAIVVSSSNGDTNTTDLDSLTESWQPGKTSPTERRQLAAMKDLGRGWAHEASFDLIGKTGNSDSQALAASYRATLDGQSDKLEFFASLNFQDTDESENPTTDDARGGIQYTNKFSEKWNWYARSEFGRDAVKEIDLFTNAALGFGRVLANTDTRKLDVQAGLGYRYEAYEDKDDLSTASLDFGISHKETFKWGDLVNRFTITPSIEELSNFRAVHDTSVQLPLKADGWSLRFGFNTDYDSEADDDLEKLDLTYYTRLVLNWK
ncbi:DUF481 domain-containing protein [Puniceicoccaceae bacterium K14]|nr:DUF481 domain-containing protein [Puniceicoccaceae bacterium K14]